MTAERTTNRSHQTGSKIQLAVAGGAGFIVTRNLRDLARGELRFPGLRVLDPVTLMKEIATWEP